MSLVRSKGNRATELRMIELFRAYKITGWRRSSRMLGKPDFVFRARRVVVFVDGCFWHGCPKHSSFPKNRAEWWAEKLAKNKSRDLHVTRNLKKLGWRVLRVWECGLTTKKWRLVARRVINALAH
jgi:DNA mismatch endonuclease, patch repair protein